MSRQFMAEKSMKDLFRLISCQNLSFSYRCSTIQSYLQFYCSFGQIYMIKFLIDLIANFYLYRINIPQNLKNQSQYYSYRLLDISLKMQNQRRPYELRNVTIDSSQEDEQQSLKLKVDQTIRREFLQNKFSDPHKHTLQQQKWKLDILAKIPAHLHNFVLKSLIIHQSQLSIVLLGSAKYIEDQQLCSQVSKQMNLSIKNYEKPPFIVIKLKISQADKEPGKQKSKQIENLDIEYCKFQGFSLSFILRFFQSSQDLIFRVQNHAIERLWSQLLRQVLFLHSNGIIHGDICPNNVLLQVKSENIKQNDMQAQVIQTFLSQQLVKLVRLILKDIEEDSQKTFLSTQDQIMIKLIDFGNSFIAKKHQSLKIANQVQNDEIQQNISTFFKAGTLKNVQRKSNSLLDLPTQTLNCRSPEALSTRGEFPIDIWGVGHLLFSLLTGREIVASESQITEKQLEQIFKDEKQFKNLILTQINRFSMFQTTSKLKDKFIATIFQCLQVDPSKRITMQQLCKEWEIQM